MNLLVVTPLYPTPGERQSGVFIHRQVRQLTACGIRCRVLAFRPAPPAFPRWIRRRAWLRYYADRLRWNGAVDGIPVDIVFYERRWTDGEDVAVSAGKALCEWVDRHPECRDTDAVYAQFAWPGGAAALALRERFGWPVAAILRGGELQEWYDRDAHCRRHVADVVGRADAMLANCEALREAAIRTVGAARPIEVVYNGCDTQRFHPPLDRSAVRRQLGFSDHDRVLMLCGSIERRKGIAELASAWRRFSVEHRDWCLVIVGRPVESALVTVLRETGSGRIRLPGLLDQQMVLRYMQAADLYVQPSRLEGLANATMEAMAVGLPVITTASWGQTELIQDGENGWLVPPEDPDALYDALAAAASDLPEARRRGVAARRTIETRFEAEVQVRRLAAVLSTMRGAAAAGMSMAPAARV